MKYSTSMLLNVDEIETLSKMHTSYVSYIDKSSQLSDRANKIFKEHNMNKEITNAELEEQSKQAVIAYLQDSSVRLERCDKESMIWEIRKSYGVFDFSYSYYRIAQPKPCYRVFECKDGSLGVTCSK